MFTLHCTSIRYFCRTEHASLLLNIALNAYCPVLNVSSFLTDVWFWYMYFAVLQLYITWTHLTLSTRGVFLSTRGVMWLFSWEWHLTTVSKFRQFRLNWAWPLEIYNMLDTSYLLSLSVLVLILVCLHCYSLLLVLFMWKSLWLILTPFTFDDFCLN